MRKEYRTLGCHHEPELGSGMLWEAPGAQHPCPTNSRYLAASATRSPSCLEPYPAKFLSSCPNSTPLHLLNSRKQLCVPHTHPEITRTLTARGRRANCVLQLPFSSPQSRRLVSSRLDAVLFSGTSAPRAGSQRSRPAPHVTLHLHLKPRRLLHCHQPRFAPLPPTNTTEMSSESDSSESEHDRSAAF